MDLLDRAAHQNRLSAVRAEHKAAVVLALLLACLLLDRITVGLGVVALMGTLSLGWARVAPRLWIKATVAEGFFLLLSVGSVALMLAPVAPPEGFGLTILGRWIGVTPQGLLMAARLVARTLGAVSCLTFLTLTTPLHDLAALGRRLQVPPLLIDLMLLTYRFLWVLQATLAQMRTAQVARLGDAGWRASLRSAGLLGARLFIRSYQRADRLNDAWLARNFDGALPVWDARGRRSSPALLATGLMTLLVLVGCRWIGLP